MITKQQILAALKNAGTRSEREVLIQAFGVAAGNAIADQRQRMLRAVTGAVPRRWDYVSIN